MSAQVATNDPEKPQNNRENENGRGNSGLSRSKTKPKIEKSGQRDKSEQKTTEGNKSKVNISLNHFADLCQKFKIFEFFF